MPHQQRPPRDTADFAALTRPTFVPVSSAPAASIAVGSTMPRIVVSAPIHLRRSYGPPRGSSTCSWADALPATTLVVYPHTHTFSPRGLTERRMMRPLFMRSLRYLSKMCSPTPAVHSSIVSASSPQVHKQATPPQVLAVPVTRLLSRPLCILLVHCQNCNLPR
jgi:hypothetical protein